MHPPIMMIIVSVLLTVGGAYLSINVPGMSAPLTLQTAAVCFAGITLGPLWSVVAMATYVGLGAAGLPVFSGGASGLDVVQGPHAGYFAGFVLAGLAIAVATRIFADDRRFTRAFFAALFGHALILGLGIAWLRHTLEWSWYFSIEKALIPFLVPAVLKSILVGIAGAWWASMQNSKKV